MHLVRSNVLHENPSWYKMSSHECCLDSARKPSKSFSWMHPLYCFSSWFLLYFSFWTSFAPAVVWRPQKSAWSKVSPWQVHVFVIEVVGKLQPRTPRVFGSFCLCSRPLPCLRHLYPMKMFWQLPRPRHLLIRWAAICRFEAVLINAAMLEEMPLHCAGASLLAKLSLKLFAVSSNLSKASSYFFSELCKCLSQTHDSSAQPHISLLWPPNWPYPRKSSQEVRLDKLCSQMPGCKTVDCQFSIYFSSHGISIRKIELKYQYFHFQFKKLNLLSWTLHVDTEPKWLDITSLTIDR